MLRVVFLDASLKQKQNAVVLVWNFFFMDSLNQTVKNVLNLFSGKESFRRNKKGCRTSPCCL